MASVFLVVKLDRLVVGLRGLLEVERGESLDVFRVTRFRGVRVVAVAVAVAAVVVVSLALVERLSIVLLLLIRRGVLCKSVNASALVEGRLLDVKTSE